MPEPTHTPAPESRQAGRDTDALKQPTTRTTTSSSTIPNARTPERPNPWHDLLPLAWLFLVIAGYALLALQPFLFPDLRPRDEVPGIADLERLVLPGLAVLLLAAAARRLIRRG